MKFKILFFCVLCLITLILSQYELSYTVDFGTETAGVLSTETSYSSSSIRAVQEVVSVVIGFGVIFAIIFGISKLDKKLDENNKKKYGKTQTKSCSCVEIFIVIAIIGVLAAMAVPNPPRRSRGEARKRACYSNMRVLNSAVEMYNMDVDGKNMMDDLDISKLVSASYLKVAPTCPDTGRSEEYSGSDLKTTGQVHCLYDKAEYPEWNHGYLHQ